MAVDTPDGGDRVVVVLIGIVLVGALSVFGWVFEPTDPLGLAVQYGAVLSAFVVAAVVLVRMYVPSADDAVESGGEPASVEWADDWGTSAEEVAVAVGVAALLVASGRASLALGSVAVFGFLPFVIAVGAAAGWWLYAPESGRAAAADHPLTSPTGVARRQMRIFGNLVVWVALALVAALFGGPTPYGIPGVAFAAVPLLALALTHWLLTRPLVPS